MAVTEDFGQKSSALVVNYKNLLINNGAQVRCRGRTGIASPLCGSAPGPVLQRRFAFGKLSLNSNLNSSANDNLILPQMKFAV